MEGWRVASKGLGPLPRRRESALAHGCGEGGRVLLPLARAAAVSTGERVHGRLCAQVERGGGFVQDRQRGPPDEHAREGEPLLLAWLGLGLG